MAVRRVHRRPRFNFQGPGQVHLLCSLSGPGIVVRVGVLAWLFLVMAGLLRLLFLLCCDRALRLLRLRARLLPVALIKRMGTLVCIRASSSL